MKLLTLNTHSLMEKDYERKLDAFVDAIVKNKPEIIALQEVMQPKNANEAHFRGEMYTIGKIPAKEGNHAVNDLNKLKEKGLDYKLVWHGFKEAYNDYDEGLCILTNQEILGVKELMLTKFEDYNSFKTRKAIAIKINDEWFYCVHFGWWDDEKSPFSDEWKSLLIKTKRNEKTWLLGDFNIDAKEQNEAYNLIKNDFYDTYLLAKDKDDGISVKGKIDGWEKNSKDKRIDYIFTNRNVPIISSKIIFNGENGEIISDHYGVMVTF